MEDMFSQYIVPAIAIACWALGEVIKRTPKVKEYREYIPAVVFVVGGILGVVSQGFTLDAIVGGVVSGLASTGLYKFGQFVTNLISSDEGGSTDVKG